MLLEEWSEQMRRSGGIVNHRKRFVAVLLAMGLLAAPLVAAPTSATAAASPSAQERLAASIARSAAKKLNKTPAGRRNPLKIRRFASVGESTWVPVPGTNGYAGVTEVAYWMHRPGGWSPSFAKALRKATASEFAKRGMKRVVKESGEMAASIYVGKKYVCSEDWSDGTGLSVSCTTRSKATQRASAVKPLIVGYNKNAKHKIARPLVFDVRVSRSAWKGYAMLETYVGPFFSPNSGAESVFYYRSPRHGWRYATATYGDDEPQCQPLWRTQERLRAFWGTTCLFEGGPMIVGAAA